MRTTTQSTSAAPTADGRQGGPRRFRALGAIALVAALAGGAAFASGRVGRSPDAPAARAPEVARPSPYAGLGTWVDVYDWSPTVTRGRPVVGPADVDAMAAAGIETLFIQTAKAEVDGDLVDPELLITLVERARAHGLGVVGWYVPTLVDEAGDLRRLLAAASLGVDGVAVDIEARNVRDVALRTQRLISLSGQLRRALPGHQLGAIVMPPVLLDVVNPGWWPGFPWRELAPLYDVWLPMSYSTERLRDSGWRDGYRYTTENIVRLRAHLGRPDAPVHTISGIADRLNRADLEGTVRAVNETGAVGASLYDWHSTGAVAWPFLTPLRRSEAAPAP